MHNYWDSQLQLVVSRSGCTVLLRLFNKCICIGVVGESRSIMEPQLANQIRNAVCDCCLKPFLLDFHL